MKYSRQASEIRQRCRNAAGQFFLLGLFVAFGSVRAKAAQTPLSSTPTSYDVVITGAGTGGVSAAIQAARMGMRVGLLEETDWIGGQMTAAGVSTMDEVVKLTPASGIYKELIDRLSAIYAAKHKSVGTCYYQTTTHCYEPSAIRSALTSMIWDTNAHSRGHIDLNLRERVVEVHEDRGRVVGVRTSRGRELQSKVLIDATEYGDVLPLTSARVRIGNLFANPGGARSGSDAAHPCTQAITYTMIIRKYPRSVPPALWMKDAPPGYERWLNKFEHSLQIDGNPKNRALPVGFAIHNAYRGIPDSSSTSNYDSSHPDQIARTSLNWFNDLPVDIRIFDRSERSKFVCDAKLATLANLYYIQHVLKETQWSVANDEGYDTPFNREENECSNIPAEFKAIEHNMPQTAYVRESQRLVGVKTLRASDIRRDINFHESVSNFPDAIAVGDYADDLHGCKSDADMEHDIERAWDTPPGFNAGPFQVPLGTLIPEKLDGLLAAEKNISQGRIANGATRLQPITMLTGQAAGVVAALSIIRNVPPRVLSPEEVQVELLISGSILAREATPDLLSTSPYWIPAQYALVHEWTSTDRGKFLPEEVLSRAAAAQMMAKAYGLIGRTDYFDQSPVRIHSTFSDLPLYDPASRAVEKLKMIGVNLSCSSDNKKFCPAEPLSTKQFIAAMDTLPGPHNLLPDANSSKAITKGEAVLLLFNRILANRGNPDASHVSLETTGLAGASIPITR